jgi:polysaccharide biosynthesis/export protein
MNTKHLCNLIVLIAIFFNGCVSLNNSSNDPVVTTTAVQKGTYGNLKAEELEQINKIRKKAPESDVNSQVDVFDDQTVKYTVHEYLSANPDFQNLGEDDYTVGGHDVLSIIVFGEKELSRKYVQISTEGFITFPLIGRVLIEGLTASEIEKLLVERFAEGQYLLDAQITVSIVKYLSKKYSVLGAIKKPGVFQLKSAEHLLDALSNAGGVNFKDAGKSSMIIRSSDIDGKVSNTKIVISVELDSLLKDADQISNLSILDKDVIYIPSKERFYIMGEVRKPGSYTFTTQNMTIVEAIGTAGGFTTIAARNKTRIIRIENNIEKIITINVDAITKSGQKVHDIQIQPGDIIIVPESFF